MTLKEIFKKKYINLVIIIYLNCIHTLFAYNIEKHNFDFNHLLEQTNNNDCSYNQNKKIYIESDKATICYPEKIELSGNILIKYNNNIIQSDNLIIHQYHDSKNISDEVILHAKGNVLLRTQEIILTGSYAQFNLKNNDVNLYLGHYFISKPHIYGIAYSIMQRKNNRYTMIKNGNFTSCISEYNSWNITGSKIMYDRLNNSMYIWNAYFKIKSIPLFYSPYLFLNMNNANILESYIPNIKFDNKYGLILKIPFPLIFSKYYSGNISPYYITNFGIGLDTKIHYKIIPGTGFCTLNIINNTIQDHTIHNQKKNYKLYWKHQGILNKKWHINADYLIKDNFKNYSNNILSNKPSKIIDDYINQKFLCYYNNKYCKISIAYLKNLNTYRNNISKNHCQYSVAPQLEMHLFFDYTQKKFFSFQLFNQFSKFIPSNYTYPETIRIHTEPIINLTINNNWIRYDTEAKLKITHYQQNKINHHYKNQDHNIYHLQDTINRIIPQFKINGKIIFQKKTNNSRKYKYFLEPKIQYLYIPYHFQENIRIYDSKIIHLDYNNLFNGIQYSGLDRIIPTNKIIGSITMQCLNKHYDKFYISIGQIINFNKDNNTTYAKNFKKHSYLSVIIPKYELYSLGVGHWNINNSWNIHSEIQYDNLINTCSFGNTTLEYINKKNTIFQTNYRYINSKYFKKNLINLNKLLYYKTISQLGIITYYPLTDNWIISFTRYHNIKSNSLIDQTIGIQYMTPCWIFSIIFERNITDWNNKSHTNLYENQIKLQFNLFNMKSNLKPNIYKFLNSKIIPYQHIVNNIQNTS